MCAILRITNEPFVSRSLMIHYYYYYSLSSSSSPDIIIALHHRRHRHLQKLRVARNVFAVADAADVRRRCPR
jgi:hypothetical protein